MLPLRAQDALLAFACRLQPVPFHTRAAYHKCLSFRPSPAPHVPPCTRHLSSSRPCRGAPSQAPEQWGLTPRATYKPTEREPPPAMSTFRPAKPTFRLSIPRVLTRHPNPRLPRAVGPYPMHSNRRPPYRPQNPRFAGLGRPKPYKDIRPRFATTEEYPPWLAPNDSEARRFLPTYVGRGIVKRLEKEAKNREHPSYHAACTLFRLYGWRFRRHGKVDDQLLELRWAESAARHIPLCALHAGQSYYLNKLLPPAYLDNSRGEHLSKWKVEPDDAKAAKYLYCGALMGQIKCRVLLAEMLILERTDLGWLMKEVPLGRDPAEKPKAGWGLKPRPELETKTEAKDEPGWGLKTKVPARQEELKDNLKTQQSDRSWYTPSDRQPHRDLTNPDLSEYPDLAPPLSLAPPTTLAWATLSASEKRLETLQYAERIALPLVEWLEMEAAERREEHTQWDGQGEWVEWSDGERRRRSRHGVRNREGMYTPVTLVGDLIEDVLQGGPGKIKFVMPHETQGH